MELVCPEALILLWFERVTSPFFPDETESPELHVKLLSLVTSITLDQSMALLP